MINASDVGHSVVNATSSILTKVASNTSASSRSTETNYSKIGVLSVIILFTIFGNAVVVLSILLRRSKQHPFKNHQVVKD